MLENILLGKLGSNWAYAAVVFLLSNNYVLDTFRQYCRVQNIMGGCQSKKVDDPIINESTKSYSDWKKEKGTVPAADAEDIDRSARHSKKYDLEFDLSPDAPAEPAS